uniref:Bm13536, isoform b n=1 Tax=Brugia malayi TaxID=6279 RepID=A0A1I9G4D1_BRUMA|nr:Bm13536, isoform b [Brugia malayi]
MGQYQMMLPCPTMKSIDSVTVVVRARNNEQTAEMAPYYCFDEQCLYRTYTHTDAGNIHADTHAHVYGCRCFTEHLS